MTTETLDKWRMELSVKAKNGIDFIFSAGITWAIISFIWALPYTSYNKSILTFMAGAIMLPMAFVFSKVFRTSWKLKDNPIQPLGLWLNFAQLFYFPFLVFVLIKMPDYFAMTYVIITGAHFFPYAWFYKTPWYAIMAGITSIGALLLGLILPTHFTYAIPMTFSGFLFVLAFVLHLDYRKKLRSVT